MTDAFSPEHGRAARRLWAAVLLAGLDDARRDPKAAAWLDTPDFRMVAALAGLDGDALADAAQRLLAPERGACRPRDRSEVPALRPRQRGGAARRAAARPPRPWLALHPARLSARGLR